MTPAVSLKPYNTFGIDAYCQHLHLITSIAQLQELLQRSRKQQPLEILGGGSNVIFAKKELLCDVAIMRTKGIEIDETETAYHLTVAAGEDWHQLVLLTLAQGIAGLENLALIPGTVGAAPIQNIGAYGVEFESVCEWVEYLDRDTGELHRLSAEQCQFAYRHSIFKDRLAEKAIITRVGLNLTKQWQANLSYGPLQGLDASSVTAQQICDLVCAVRQQKLPDPKELGNAGSFFKNPIIDSEQYLQLALQYPDIAAYPMTDGRVKIAAAWLIDRAGLKGYQQQGVGVHQQQALVLVNIGQASGESVCAMRDYIQEQVKNLFAIQLEAEPRFIPAQPHVNTGIDYPIGV